MVEITTYGVNRRIEKTKGVRSSMEGIGAHVDPSHKRNHRVMVNMQTGHLRLLLSEHKENGVQLVDIFGHQIAISHVNKRKSFRRSVVGWSKGNIEHVAAPVGSDHKPDQKVQIHH